MRFGYRATPETRANISAGVKAAWQRPETRDAFVQGLSSKRCRKRRNERIAAALQDPAVREKMRVGQFNRPRYTCVKCGIVGTTSSLDPEHPFIADTDWACRSKAECARRVARARPKAPVSEETRAKMRAAHVDEWKRREKHVCVYCETALYPMHLKLTLRDDGDHEYECAVVSRCEKRIKKRERAA